MNVTPIQEANWTVFAAMTESAGLKIFLADYRGRRVLWEGSLPYVTIDHQRQDVGPEDTSAEGHGPWWSPLGARSLFGDVRKASFRGGFELACDFATGPYRYTQLWRFHEDGRLSPWLVIHAGGVHEAHTYHPHWRFDFDVDGALDDAVEYWDGGRWTRIAEEGWFTATADRSPEGYVWRQIDFGSGASVNIRPQHREDAEVFAIRYREGEWPPFTPRAAAGDQTFPAGYAGAEPIDDEDVTLWYVAHVHRNDAFPFTAGPWIHVEGFGGR